MATSSPPSAKINQLSQFQAIDLEPIDFEHFIDEPDLDRPNMEKMFRQNRAWDLSTASFIQSDYLFWWSKYIILGLIFSAESKKPSLIKHACSEPGSHTVKVWWGAGRLTPAPTATTTTTTATTIYNYINNNTNTLVNDNIYKTSTNKSVNDMNSSNNYLRTYSEPFHLWKSGSSFNWKVVTFLVFFPCQCLNFSFWLEKLKHYDYCYS